MVRRSTLKTYLVIAIALTLFSAVTNLEMTNNHFLSQAKILELILYFSKGFNSRLNWHWTVPTGTYGTLAKV